MMLRLSAMEKPLADVQKRFRKPSRLLLRQGQEREVLRRNTEEHPVHEHTPRELAEGMRLVRPRHEHHSGPERISLAHAFERKLASLAIGYLDALVMNVLAVKIQQTRLAQAGASEHRNAPYSISGQVENTQFRRITVPERQFKRPSRIGFSTAAHDTPDVSDPSGS